MSVSLAMTSFRQKLLDREPCKEPRWRFMRYYMDLMTLYGKELTEKTFLEGSQYTYSELGERILEDSHVANELTNLDLLIVSYWSNEFDPDHATCGAYLSHKYNLNCKIFDVCEQGTVAPFTAINIIQKFIKHSPAKKALLLILEQTTIPRIKEDHDLIPQHSGAIAITFEESTADNTVKLIVAEIMHEKDIAEKSDKIFDYVKQQYLPSNVSDKEIIFHLRKNDFLWKLFQYTNSPINSETFSSAAGCYPAFVSLANCYKSTYKYHILLDQDVETLNVGILILHNKTGGV